MSPRDKERNTRKELTWRLDDFCRPVSRQPREVVCVQFLGLGIGRPLGWPRPGRPRCDRPRPLVIRAQRGQRGPGGGAPELAREGEARGHRPPVTEPQPVHVQGEAGQTSVGSLIIKLNLESRKQKFIAVHDLCNCGYMVIIFESFQGIMLSQFLNHETHSPLKQMSGNHRG